MNSLVMLVSVLIFIFTVYGEREGEGWFFFQFHYGFSLGVIDGCGYDITP